MRFVKAVAQKAGVPYYTVKDTKTGAEKIMSHGDVVDDFYRNAGKRMAIRGVFAENLIVPLEYGKSGKFTYRGIVTPTKTTCYFLMGVPITSNYSTSATIRATNVYSDFLDKAPEQLCQIVGMDKQEMLDKSQWLVRQAEQGYFEAVPCIRVASKSNAEIQTYQTAAGEKRLSALQQAVRRHRFDEFTEPLIVDIISTQSDIKVRYFDRIEPILSNKNDLRTKSISSPYGTCKAISLSTWVRHHYPSEQYTRDGDTLLFTLAGRKIILSYTAYATIYEINGCK